MNNVITNIKDLPAGYFRIHWPQYQVLMDELNYDEDVIFCDEAASVEGLSTIALPISYLKKLEDELGKNTKAYILFLNQKIELN